MTDGGTYELAPDPEPRRGAAAPKPVGVVPLKGEYTPCPSCGYDLRGASEHRCPECGKTFTDHSLARAKRKKEAGIRGTEWFMPAVLLGIGVVVSTCIYGGIGLLDSGSMGLAWMLVFLAVNLVTSVVVGSAVYAAFCTMWIGWANSIPVTILQVAAVYALATGITGIVELVSPLGVITWIVSVLTLVGLLCKILDIEYGEAIAVAVVSSAIKIFIVMLVVHAITQGA